MKRQPFGLSTSNGVFLAIVYAVFGLGYIAFAEKSSRSFGYLTGQVLAFLMFPAFFAWIVWLISGRRRKAASITFNIVLALMMLGQLNSAGKKQREGDLAQEFQNLQTQKNNFKNEYAKSGDDPAAVEDAYNQYAASVQSGLDRISEKGSDSDKQLAQIMKTFVGETQEGVTRWRDTWNAVIAPRILDYSVLTTAEEFEYQRKVVRLHLEHTKAYSSFFQNMVSILEERLRPLGDNPDARDALKGLRDKHQIQKPVFDELMRAHLRYGDSILKLLDLLETHQDGWRFQNEELVFDEESVLIEFNKIVTSWAKDEETINRISDQIMQSL